MVKPVGLGGGAGIIGMPILREMLNFGIAPLIINDLTRNI